MACLSLLQIIKIQIQHGIILWIGYGLLQQGNNPYAKTVDRIDFVSKYEKKTFLNFYYTVLVNFKI